MSIFVSSALFAAVVFLAALGLRAIEDIERENRLVEAELRASQLYRESLDERVEQVRRYRHDADGLLRAIEHSLREDAPETAVCGVDANAEPATSGGDAATLFLLSRASIKSKQRLCRDADIAFECDIDPSFFALAAKRDVGDADLCIVLQNLLDNAYEACQEARANGTKPSMTLRMTPTEPEAPHTRTPEPDCLHIEVRNTVAGTQPPEFRTRKAQFRLHGIGLQAVRDIIRAHNGRLDWSFDESAHAITIVAWV